ncbi:PorT family protein [Niabella pedocola]|uniref:PorT family protein n=1 Tax=Niabella pedocola TaxID=1752077 RepID=A0ABS8PPJ5_9BACT|nr:outer membrane beta-barrel protein [Niabella pedocola]MCD2422941.1 PorT family protein [Niabella pedocola]
MRKTYLLLLVLACLFVKGNTQVLKSWYAEAQASGGHSWYSNYRGNTQWHPHYKAGVNLVRMGGHLAGFGAGIAFSGEGVSKKYLNLGTRHIENAYYIKVPLFARLLLNRTRKIQPFADAGMEGGFFTGGQSRYIQSDKKSFKDNTVVDNEIDLGLFTRLGVVHRLNDRFTISGFGNYYHGLSQKTHLIGGQSPYVTNRNIAIGIGLARKL